jgi:ATP-dependent DNA ligase
MLARLARELPADGGVAFEPKWDGFRCLPFVDGGEVDLRSRNDRPLARYFPEVVAALAGLGDVVLDGELVASRDGRPDFPALLGRLHPAASRTRLLAVATPATFLAFDVLAAGGQDLRDRPYRERRRRLEDLVAGVGTLTLSPATDDRARAAAWLDAPPTSGIDGVVVKPLDGPYVAGARGWTKVKRDRTADCVVAGFRWRSDNDGVSSLLLGLYDDHDPTVLHHVGATGSMAKALRQDVSRALAPLVQDDLAGHPWEHGFALEGGPQGRLKGSAGRWSPDLPRDWFALPPVVVAEVGYDQLDGHRFRHPARFRHFRPDRDPASCTVVQLC